MSETLAQKIIRSRIEREAKAKADERFAENRRRTEERRRVATVKRHYDEFKERIIKAVNTTSDLPKPIRFQTQFNTNGYGDKLVNDSQHPDYSTLWVPFEAWLLTEGLAARIVRERTLLGDESWIEMKIVLAEYGDFAK